MRTHQPADTGGRWSTLSDWGILGSVESNQRLPEQVPPGYYLSGPDNNAVMLGREGSWPRCAACGYLLNREEVDPAFSLAVAEGELIDYGVGEIEAPAFDSDAKRIFDFSYTYDGRPILSASFRDVLLAACTTPVEFIELPREPAFFLLRPQLQMAWDAERGHARFGDRCGTCGDFTYVVGPSRFVLHPELLDPLGMYRSDLEFGDGDEKHPLEVVGRELATTLSALSGVVLHELAW